MGGGAIGVATLLRIDNPATGATVGEVAVAGPDEIEKALEVGTRAKRVWAQTPVHARYDILVRYSQLLARHRQRLADLLTAESGKLTAETLGEVDTGTRLFQGYAERAKTLHGDSFPLDVQAGLEHDLLITRREPLGLMLAIIPFNFPVDVFSHKVAPALAAGNAVIVCPPPDDPLAVNEAVRLFDEAGLPPGVVQVLNGPGPDVAGRMTGDPRVDAISLTGSTRTGITVAESGARHLARTFLELGGNDALIVFADADLELAAREAVGGRLLANGQCCCANKRLIVERSVAADFGDLLVEALRGVRMGNPAETGVNLGPLIKGAAAERVEAQVQQTLAQGARLRLGGSRGEGSYFPPTLLEGVPAEADIAADMEVFGPVFPLIPFDTEADALAVANRSVYGLNGSVFTRDMARAVRVSFALECGLVSVNRSGLYRPDLAGFGGYKLSGLGREGLAYSLEQLTQLKSVALRDVL